MFQLYYSRGGYIYIYIYVYIYKFIFVFWVGFHVFRFQDEENLMFSPWTLDLRIGKPNAPEIHKSKVYGDGILFGFWLPSGNLT